MINGPFHHKATEQLLGIEKKGNKNKWWDEECDQIIQKKKITRIKWIKTGQGADYERYKEIRKEGNGIMKKKKNNGWIR